MTHDDWQREWERMVRRAWRRHGPRIVAYYHRHHRFRRIWLAVTWKHRARVHVRVGRKWVYFLHDTSPEWWGIVELGKIARANV
jgi:hypothetical protein